MKTSAKLKELRSELRTLTATIEAISEQRRELRVQIERETARLEQEEAQKKTTLENQVIARLDTGMTAPEIAAAVGCTRSTVVRIIAEWRARQGTTLRRHGHPLPERRGI